MRYKEEIIIHQKITDMVDNKCERCDGTLIDQKLLGAGQPNLFMCPICSAFETFSRDDGLRMKDANRRFM